VIVTKAHFAKPVYLCNTSTPTTTVASPEHVIAPGPLGLMVGRGGVKHCTLVPWPNVLDAQVCDEEIEAMTDEAPPPRPKKRATRDEVTA
jgi:hypothetical protein